MVAVLENRPYSLSNSMDEFLSGVNRGVVADACRYASVAVKNRDDEALSPLRDKNSDSASSRRHILGFLSQMGRPTGSKRPVVDGPLTLEQLEAAPAIRSGEWWRSLACRSIYVHDSIHTSLCYHAIWTRWRLFGASTTDEALSEAFLSKTYAARRKTVELQFSRLREQLMFPALLYETMKGSRKSFDPMREPKTLDTLILSELKFLRSAQPFLDRLTLLFKRFPGTKARFVITPSESTGFEIWSTQLQMSLQQLQNEVTRVCA